MTEKEFVTSLLSRLPKSIRVAGHQISIAIWDRNESAGRERFAEWSAIEQKIKICESLATRQKVVDSFMHELFHAMYWAYAVDDKDEEERLANVFGTAYMTLFRDNPWLLDWIKSAELNDVR